MKTSLDEELRERFADRDEGRRLLEHARQELDAYRSQAEETGDLVDRSHVGRWLQRTSEYLRLCGELDEAMLLKEETLTVWEELGKHRAHFLVRLQLALVHAELDPVESASRFAALDEEMSGDENLEPFYRAFWLEYEARRSFWAGDTARAAELLEDALDFRREHRAARIVEWTEAALKTVRRQLQKV